MGIRAEALSRSPRINPFELARTPLPCTVFKAGKRDVMADELLDFRDAVPRAATASQHA